MSGQRTDEQGVLRTARDFRENILLLATETAAASISPPQLVRLEENGEAPEKRRIEIRYGDAELKLPEDVDLKAVVSLLHALRSHD